jgi:uncharacterized protein (TIRG00374 family)
MEPGHADTQSEGNGPSPSATEPPSSDAAAAETVGSSSRRRWVAQALLLLVGAGVLVAFVYTAGPALVASNILRVGWGFGALMGLSMLWRALAALGMWLLIEPQRRPPWSTVMWVRMAGEAVNTLTPLANFGGEPVKARLLSASLGVADSAAAVLLDKTLVYLASVLFMITGLVLGASWLTDGSATLPLAGGLVLLWVILLSLLVRLQARGELASSVSRLAARFGTPLSAQRQARLAEIDQAMLRAWTANRAGVLASLAAHFLGRSLRAVDVWMCVWLLGGQVGVSQAYFAAATGMLFGTAFAFIPGSLGASEGGHAYAFDVIGLGVTMGVSVGLVRRIRTYALAGVTYVLVVGRGDLRE